MQEMTDEEAQEIQDYLRGLHDAGDCGGPGGKCPFCNPSTSSFFDDLDGDE